ncbi:MAG: putative glycoside hydrolase [Actinomycetota bacterium]|nr:putative glycoside hydrolase [Actinomycetota bacterium]
MAKILVILLIFFIFIIPLNILKAETYEEFLSNHKFENTNMEPGTQKAVYLTEYSIADIKKRKEIYELVSNTELNSIVFDVKDDSGSIGYDSSIELAGESGAEKKYYNIDAVLREMKSKGIYSIARFVVFKDNILSRFRPDVAIKDIRTGNPLYSEGSYWPDIYCEEVWDYYIDIIKELAEKGVNEIQFDYIRAPAKGNIAYADYTYNTAGNDKVWAITNFLKKVKEAIRQYNIKISADVFGWTFIVDNDQGIGQMLEEIAPHLDYIYPMPYPSHYSTNFLGYELPEAHPYEVVSYTLNRGLARIDNTGCIAVPWIQAFSLKVKYTEREIISQIQAAEDLGIEGFLFWNAANKYGTVEKVLNARENERELDF